MKTTKNNEWKNHPFRRAVLRGLGVVLPPLLTIVIFIWVWSTIQSRVLAPVEGGARKFLTWYNEPFLDAPPAGITPTVSGQGGPTIYVVNGHEYVQVPDGSQLMRRDVLQFVQKNPGTEMPKTAEGIYHRYLSLTYLRRLFVVPMFLSVFILLLYFLGKFFAAGVGRILWNVFEQLVQRLPIIRNVYGSVKQVTDFVFSEQEIEYTRVVAVEYPRKGMWSIGFVTGESMLDIRSAANEPVVSVLMPTSPMPATGFTVTVRKSETIDLNITIDQAIQFVVSCGVVVPSEQQDRLEAKEITESMVRQLEGVQNKGALSVSSAVSSPLTKSFDSSDTPDSQDSASTDATSSNGSERRGLFKSREKRKST